MIFRKQQYDTESIQSNRIDSILYPHFRSFSLLLFLFYLYVRCDEAINRENAKWKKNRQKKKEIENQ